MQYLLWRVLTLSLSLSMFPFTALQASDRRSSAGIKIIPQSPQDVFITIPTNCPSTPPKLRKSTKQGIQYVTDAKDTTPRSPKVTATGPGLSEPLDPVLSPLTEAPPVLTRDSSSQALQNFYTLTKSVLDSEQEAFLHDFENVQGRLTRDILQEVHDIAQDMTPGGSLSNLSKSSRAALLMYYRYTNLPLRPHLINMMRSGGSLANTSYKFKWKFLVRRSYALSDQFLWMFDEGPWQSYTSPIIAKITALAIAMNMTTDDDATNPEIVLNAFQKGGRFSGLSPEETLLILSQTQQILGDRLTARRNRSAQVKQRELLLAFLGAVDVHNARTQRQTR